MKNLILISSSFLFLFALNSCGSGGGGTIHAAKGTFKAVAYPFENPESTADGKMVAVSSQSFIIVSHLEDADSVRLAAYSADSVDLLWRASVAMSKNEEVDYNSLFISSGNLVLFTNIRSHDSVYYRARMIDVKNGSAGDVHELIQAAPEEYANGPLEPNGGGIYGIRYHGGVFGISYNDNHNLFKAEFSPDSSKLLLLTVGKDAVEKIHKSDVSANILILDRNLAVLKNAKIKLLTPGDSGITKGYAIDNSGNIYFTTVHEDGDMIMVKEFAVLGDGNVKILRNMHPQDQREMAHQERIGITAAGINKVYVAALLTPVEKYWNGIKHQVAGNILSLSRFDFSSNSIAGSSIFIGDTISKRFFNEDKFEDPDIDRIIVDESLDRVILLIQESGGFTRNNMAFDYFGNILLSGYTLSCTPAWMEGVKDYEQEEYRFFLMTIGSTSSITSRKTLRLFHKKGFYRCDEFDMKTGARLNPPVAGMDLDEYGEPILDLHGVNHYPWYGYRLSENSEVFVSKMPTPTSQRSIVKVMMTK